MRHFCMDTDASDVHVRSILLQKQQADTLKRIEYWYRSLKDAEHKNHNTHRESLANVRAVLLLQPNLEGSQ